jgi:hypothetical protein
MKTGGLITATCVLAVLGGLVFWAQKHPPSPATPTPAVTKIISDDSKQIENISITKFGSDPVVLTKVADKWEITKPSPMPADQDTAGALVNAVAALNADRLIDEKAADLNPYGLAAPGGDIEISLKGGKKQKLLVGGDTPSGSATYVKLDGDAKVYSIPSFTKTSLSKSLEDLRDKRLLTFDQDKLTVVTLTSKGPAVEFARNKQSEWQITKPKPFRADGLQVDELVRKLKDAKMDLGTDAKAAATAFAAAPKIATATVIDSAGTQTIEVHKGKDNAYYAKSSAADGIYKVAGDLDGLDKAADDFRNKKVFDFGFNDPTKLDVSGKTYQKSGDKWTVGTAQFDAPSVQAVMDKLRDLSATKFADKMSGSPALTLTVTSNTATGDNGRVEKVTINKDGDSYAAQRDGDASIYIIDAKNMDEVQKAIAGIKPYEPPKSEKKK